MPKALIEATPEFWEYPIATAIRCRAGRMGA